MLTLPRWSQAAQMGRRQPRRAPGGDPSFPDAGPQGQRRPRARREGSACPFVRLSLQLGMRGAAAEAARAGDSAGTGVPRREWWW